jgi:phage repressor protein C with HTH and peptisase S24 domain
MTRFGLEELKQRTAAAVEAEGLRAFSRRAGVGIGSVRSVLEGRDPSFSNADAIATSLGLNLGFGPVPQPQFIDKAPDAEFARIPLYDAGLAAGVGLINDSEEVIDFLAFRRDWLNGIGVTPANAILARVEGDSMLPTLHAGDMVLIDRARRDIPVRKRGRRSRRRAPIYALRDDGKARIKRIERPEEDVLMLLSDNSSIGPDLIRAADIAILDIIGQVMWWGHTNRE